MAVQMIWGKENCIQIKRKQRQTSFTHSFPRRKKTSSAVKKLATSYHNTSINNHKYLAYLSWLSAKCLSTLAHQRVLVFLPVFFVPVIQNITNIGFSDTNITDHEYVVWDTTYLISVNYWNLSCHNFNIILIFSHTGLDR